MKITFNVKNEEQKAVVIQAITEYRLDNPYQVIIQPLRKNRTIAQNRLLHMWFNEISEKHNLNTGDAFSAQAWKEQLKRMFLGYDEVAMPNQSIAFVTKSTAKCTTKELSEFMEKIDVFCADDLGIILTSPEDLYNEAMGYV